MPSGDGGGYAIGRCNGRIRVFNKSAIKTCSGPYQRHADDKCLAGDRTCSSSMQRALKHRLQGQSDGTRGRGLIDSVSGLCRCSCSIKIRPYHFQASPGGRKQRRKSGQAGISLYSNKRHQSVNQRFRVLSPLPFAKTTTRTMCCEGFWQSYSVISSYLQLRATCSDVQFIAGSVVVCYWASCH